MLGTGARLRPWYPRVVLRVDFVTLFPEMVLPVLGHSMLGRAQERQRVAFGAVNPRDFAYDRHRKVDDSPYGGGPGMLMKAEPVALALESLQPDEDAAVVLTDPSGTLFNQSVARDLSERSTSFFLCGRTTRGSITECGRNSRRTLSASAITCSRTANYPPW